VTAVNTTQGKIICEKVINCGGQWARQIGAMAGVSVPLQPVKHQYVITEKVPGLAADAATIRDPDRRTYFKEEVVAWCLVAMSLIQSPGRKGMCRTISSSSYLTMTGIILNSI